MPDSPFAIIVFLVSSIVSTWFMWGAFRTRNVPRLLMGVGSGIPSFAPTSFNCWVLATLVFGGGIWLQRYIDG